MAVVYKDESYRIMTTKGTGLRADGDRSILDHPRGLR